MTLVASRRVWSTRVTVEWVDPASRELVEPPKQPFEAADWRQALERVVLESFHFWLGAENMPKDAYLRRHVRAREDRFVPLHVFAHFKRLKVLLQDLRWMAQILRTSTVLEVVGEGEEAMVRALQDYSVRPNEGPDQVARQRQAMASVTAGNFRDAVLAMRQDYYTRRAGPTADGAPPVDDILGTERHRSRAFLDGIEWVIRYYTRGCSSWSWFYPAHYPPLCASLAMHVEEPLQAPPLHAPFPPTLQLLAVLPPQSAPLLPEALRPLLLDRSSPLIDFYPRDFAIDLKEGDKEWQATVLLPFVDEGRLRVALAALPWSEDGSQSEPARAFLASSEATAAEPGASTAVASWDFRPQEQLPEGRPGHRPFPAASGASPPNNAKAGPRGHSGRAARNRGSVSGISAPAAAGSEARGEAEATLSKEAPEGSEAPAAPEEPKSLEDPATEASVPPDGRQAAWPNDEDTPADASSPPAPGQRLGDCRCRIS
mmetsp:Transcript_51848/g.162857  ORF Transcript_51848/g.162857 Transcript_51848/m.162857 type:complete len:486 (+) Transcript_51848:2-1459(+)